MEKSIRLFVKMLLIIAGIAIIGYILMVSVRMNQVKQPEGDYLRLKDALILTEALNERYRETDVYIELQRMAETKKEPYLTYGQFLRLADRITMEQGNGVYTDKEGTEVKDIQEYLKNEYRQTYKENHYMLAKDWYIFYDGLLSYYGKNEDIFQSDVVILGTEGDFTGAAGENPPENQLLSDKGIYEYKSDLFSRYKYQVIRVYRKEETFLTVRQVVSRGYDLHNIWIMEAGEGEIRVFLQDCEVRIPFENAEETAREQVADLDFADGRLQSAHVKTEKISGKLLSVKDGQIELEGQGKYEYEQELKVYKLYGRLSEGSKEELRIGYDFTDYVLEDGKVCAALITREEAMENIRVVIKNTDFAGAFHEKVAFTADTGFTVRYGAYDKQKEASFAAGETVTLEKDSGYFDGDRVYIVPEALTGKIKLLSLNRAQGNPEYRGKLEIEKTKDGLVIVNEVLLEEYLYSVVPSEMPASYPLEALKAQAICARTYAYRHLMKSGIADFGAHVDDSAGYQVYNNIAENAQTTKAVKETAGQLLYYGEELCGSYYYSTSCGFGSDIHIWKSDSAEDASYLTAKRIGSKEGDYTGETMTKEEVFSEFINRSFSSDYEAEEAWYRWNYEVEEVDAEKILLALQKRYEANEKLVLTGQKDGSFASRPVKRLGKIKEIKIEKRNAGGAADELLIVGTKNTFKVISEHNIRYVLNDGKSKVIRQDGSEVASPTLLPSAYMTISTSKENKVVVGYKLSGGGYGHGVGMSQNGARNMAQKGFDAQGILTFFYQSCEIRDIY